MPPSTLVQSTFRLRFGMAPRVLAVDLRMGCILILLLAAFPRVALLLVFFLSNYLERAYHGLIVPLLGFIFLPLTTLAYAWVVNTGQPLTGTVLLILLVTVVIDLGGLGGGAYRRGRW